MAFSSWQKMRISGELFRSSAGPGYKFKDDDTLRSQREERDVKEQRERRMHENYSGSAQSV